MLTCPNCGQSVEMGKKICPHCGTVLSPVWPPPPVGYDTPAKAFGEDLLTGSARLDFWLGLGGMLLLQIVILVIGYYNVTVLLALFAVGVIGLIAYFIVRPRYPVLARGIGWGVVTVPTFLLGAVFVCLASLSRNTTGFGRF